jgi:type IV pilus assembly protein PilB
VVKPTKKRLRLGDALIQDGLITDEQLQASLAKQKKTGKRLGEVLVEMGLVKEEEIVEVLGRQLGMPYINLTNYLIDPITAKIIPEHVSKRHKLIPINKVGNKLTVAMVDPLNVLAIDDIQLMTGLIVKPVVATSKDIQDAINKTYGGAEGNTDGLMDELEDIGKDERALEDDGLDALGELGENDAPIIKLCNLIIAQAVEQGVSDIHVECYEKEVRVRYRLDGSLFKAISPPKRAQAAISSRIKIMSKLNIAEKRLPQDGRIKIKVGGKTVDLRVSILPCIWGEKIVMRILDQSNLQLDLEKLGFEPKMLKRFFTAIFKPNGIVLVTGPTGSGKTTTLYSALFSVSKPDVNVMTAEDPVEYMLHGVNQVQCRSEIGLTFAAALRSFLRQDPDVIMVGEIRDFETAEIAIKASLTGHLVLSTLHTNDAPGTIGRLLNMGIEPFMVATSVLIVQAQRLVKTICKDCRVEYKPKTDVIQSLEIDHELLVFLELPHLDPERLLFYKGKGCESCRGTGLKGRLGVYEVMYMSEKLKKMVLDGASTAQIKKVAHEEGMLSLRQSALRKLLIGKTTVAEVLRVTHED